MKLKNTPCKQGVDAIAQLKKEKNMEEFEQKLNDLGKSKIILYAMQLRFERNFLQQQLDKYEDFIQPIPDGKVQQLKEKLTPDEMGVILETFVDYVNEIKRYKIGVGHALIQRYLNDTYGVRDDR